MKKIITNLIAVLMLNLVVGLSPAFSDDDGVVLLKAVPGRYCKFILPPSSNAPSDATATVTITPHNLKVQYKNTNPNKLYSCWIDHKNRHSGLLADDYPEGANARGVAPCFATTAGVTEGIGIDPNTVISNNAGNATLRSRLDYNPLQPGASPVVAVDLTNHPELGTNRIGGSWLRTYEGDGDPAKQVVDPDTGLPVLPRSTAQGLTLQVHTSFISHGHTPGIGGVDHANVFKGDFPVECLL